MKAKFMENVAKCVQNMTQHAHSSNFDASMAKVEWNVDIRGIVDDEFF